MIDNLDTHSGYSRRMLLESEMMTDVVDIDRCYSVLKKFFKVINIDENKYIVNTLQQKLCNLKDIQGTINNLRNRNVLNDIELFEIKHLSLLSYDVRQIINQLNINDCVNIPDLSEVERILDPDGMRIATFYIYDSYSERLSELRRMMKVKEDFDESLFNDANAIEDEIRIRLSSSLSKYADDIFMAQKSLAIIDLNVAKACQMMKYGLCFPELSSDDETSYQGMFNPEVSEIVGENYQPINIRFGKHPTIIMGTNMGGKTLVIKTLALCQYLFQFGLGIPAKSAKIMCQNDVFLCTTDEQSIYKGLSSFAAEMMNINEIVKTSRSGNDFLALVDEPARTTNPTEGTALVSALVKILQDRKMSLIVVTHYNINTFGNRCLRVKGFDDGKMNYELVEVVDGEVPHEALNIAESLGIDKEWLEESRRALLS
ncbi:MAG: hypothetical protein ACI358_03705 [Candidatus Limimorpha sp.]